MLKMHYIVNPQKEGREEFYNYLIENNYQELDFTKEEYIKGHFPFIINEKYKVFSMLNSITCCAQASQAKKIMSTEDFFNIVLK